jgi:tRNA nucleotidyltransferase (CCA-adding enzyme)
MLDELSKERIYGEFKKLLLKGRKISMGVDFLKQTHSFKYFTQLNMQEEKYNHTLKLLERFSNNKTDTMIIPLSLLCYEMNNADTKIFLDKITNEKNLFDKITRLKKVAKYLQYKEAPPTYSLIQKTDMKELEIFLKFLKLKVNMENLKPIITPKEILMLGVKPSKKFSEILNSTYEAQLFKLFKTHKEGVLWLKTTLNYLSL